MDKSMAKSRHLSATSDWQSHRQCPTYSAVSTLDALPGFLVLCAVHVQPDVAHGSILSMIEFLCGFSEKRKRFLQKFASVEQNVL